MDLVRHFLLRIPSIPTQINHLSMYLQLNPSRSAEAHGKARFGWGVPAQGPASQPSSTWAERRQGHTAPAESGGQHRPQAPQDTTAKRGLLRDEASDLDGHQDASLGLIRHLAMQGQRRTWPESVNRKRENG